MSEPCRNSRNYPQDYALEAYLQPPLSCVVEFEWGDEKHKAMLHQGGLGFDFAVVIFAGPVIERRDSRRAHGEIPIQAIGEVEGVALFVA